MVKEQELRIQLLKNQLSVWEVKKQQAELQINNIIEKIERLESSYSNNDNQ
jgi:uncharacterized protein (UPF0335 family)